MIVDSLLDNRFVIDDAGPPLGTGGMAIIYAGNDTETGDEIAAKTLLPAFQGDTNRRRRFRREADVLRAVQSEHIVRLIDVVDGRRGTWIVMERLYGDTIRHKLDAEGAFRPSTIDSWLTQIAAGLEHMHRQGYVHLDITPQNIFLTDGGDAKVIDFGIAQSAYRAPQREGNKLLGTAAYISPEHGSGSVVTPLSDIYSLGCVVFELLTGRKVFSEHANVNNEATVVMRQSAVPELPTSVAPELNLPAWVDTVVAHAIMPNPEDRYPSVTAFAEAFHERSQPPSMRLHWPRKRAAASPATSVAIDRSVHAEPARPAETGARYAQTPLFGWMRKELRNARRALMVFAMMMALVFGLPMVGGNAVGDWMLGLVPGSTTNVVDGNWNVRSSAATDAEVRAVIQQGTHVRVTGNPVIVDSGMWWPIRVDVDNTEVAGWAHDDGLERTWLMNRVAGYQEMRNDLDNLWSEATGLLPG